MAIAKVLAARPAVTVRAYSESSFVAEVKSDLMGEQTILKRCHAAGRFSAVFRQAGGQKAPTRLMREKPGSSSAVGNHHRSAEAGRHHPDDDGPSV